MQEWEFECIGILSFKIVFNNVFGYYLEVWNIYKEWVLEDWIWKQMLVNVECYIIFELKEYEIKIFGVEDCISQLELVIYYNLLQ